MVRDEDQFKRAQNLIRREAHVRTPAYVSLLVLLETEWVLRSRYKVNKAEILATVSDLLSAAEMSFEDEPSIEEGLFIWKDSTAQLADCLISARHRTLGCSATATFSKDAKKLPGFVSA